MTHISWFLLFFLSIFSTLKGQDKTKITGSIYSQLNNETIEKALVTIEGDIATTTSDTKGFFSFKAIPRGNYIIAINYLDYVEKRIPVTVTETVLELGSIYLQKDIALEKQNNLITLSDTELLDDGSSANALGLLQSTRDIFLTRAAFDFGQAFFRVRGYDSQYGEIMLNGIAMNKSYDGRPQWNNWGGLNDVIRNQEFTNGLSPSNFTFGGILGNTNIDLRPSGLRPGLRLSSSASNRTYTSRLMATYTSEVSTSGLAYTLSGSRRWAKEGYMKGTVYDAFSLYGMLEYEINNEHSISLATLTASNRRGRSSAMTEEVFELVGNRYNPYWGKQDGEIRNSRERHISEPMALFNYYYTTKRVNVTAGFAYQSGKYTKSRVGYYNAPNPDPTYYRYLPSYHINSSIGANFLSANEAKDSFIKNPQWNWQQLYDANRNTAVETPAAYILYDDTTKDTQLTANISGNIEINKHLKLDVGVSQKHLNSENYASIVDLLGADFHEDIDSFSDTRNDLNSTSKKGEGDTFNYKYQFNGVQTQTFAQLQLDYNAWKGFVAVRYETDTYGREGFYKNERFIENSLGRSSDVTFDNIGVKGGFTHRITGRHWITGHAARLNKAPTLQNIFINPRESNAVVPNLQSETISSLDINYFLRLPKLTGRLSGFHTRFQNITDVNFFFVDAGVGSDFVQEVLTDLDKLHMGVELGLGYQISASVKLSFVAAVGKYSYASNPDVTINFDTASAEEELIDVSGFKELGSAAIKDMKLAQGPQKALAFGVEYRDPKYWWLGVTANYLGNNYANISTITRTDSFYLDPDTGVNFPEATKENVTELLAQKPLDNFYLLNMVGGKSWLKKGKYIGLFVSVNNLFDTTFRTGGYEQSRKGNYRQLKQDNASGSPSFAPKYWYGYGRTYFLNLAISF